MAGVAACRFQAAREANIFAETGPVDPLPTCGLLSGFWHCIPYTAELSKAQSPLPVFSEDGHEFITAKRQLSRVISAVDTVAARCLIR